MAQFILAFRMAIKSILSNKLRSFLTMLGVIIGIWAVIAVVGLAQGSTKSITDRLQRAWDKSNTDKHNRKKQQQKCHI